MTSCGLERTAGLLYYSVCILIGHVNTGTIFLCIGNSLGCIQTEDFAKSKGFCYRLDSKDVPICYDFALMFLKQNKQKKLIKYSPVMGYLLGNPLGSVERRMSFENPLANLL